MNIRDFTQIPEMAWEFGTKKSEVLAKDDHLHNNAWGFKMPKVFLYLGGLKDEVRSWNGH